MLTPQDIAVKLFTVARMGKGYDQNEVDEFLDVIAEDYTAALRQIDDLTTKLRAVPSASEVTQVLTPVAASGGPTLETISLLLQQAETTAAQIKSDADAKAAQVVATAQYQASQVTGKAQVDANDIVAKAQAEAAAARDKVTELQNVHASVSATLQDALNRLAPATAPQEAVS